MTTFICFAPSLVGSRSSKYGITINTTYIKDIEPSFDGKDVCFIHVHGDDYPTQINLSYDTLIDALKNDDVVGIKLIKV